jgi:hypothetical protein
VQDRALEDHPTSSQINVRWSRILTPKRLGMWPGGRRERSEVKECSVELVNRCDHCCHQLGGALRDGLEHGLGIRRRVRDYAKNVRGRRLLLQRFGHLGMCVRQRDILLLQLREQPHVLDGDHRLVGEGFEEGNLALGERPGLRASHSDHPDRGTVS